MPSCLNIWQFYNNIHARCFPFSLVTTDARQTAAVSNRVNHGMSCSTLGSKKCEHKAAFPLSCPIKIAICRSPCSTMWKAVCLDDNVEMTDRSIQGGFCAVGLPRAINRRGGPKEGKKGGESLEMKEEGGRGERQWGKTSWGQWCCWLILGCIRLQNINTVRMYTFKKKKESLDSGNLMFLSFTVQKHKVAVCDIDCLPSMNIWSRNVRFHLSLNELIYVAEGWSVDLWVRQFVKYANAVELDPEVWICALLLWSCSPMMCPASTVSVSGLFTSLQQHVSLTCTTECCWITYPCAMTAAKTCLWLASQPRMMFPQQLNHCLHHSAAFFSFFAFSSGLVCVMFRTVLT